MDLLFQFIYHPLVIVLFDVSIPMFFSWLNQVSRRIAFGVPRILKLVQCPPTSIPVHMLGTEDWTIYKL